MSLLSIKQVQELVPVSRATLQRWENDGIFPKRFHIGGNGAWQKAFYEKDVILAWIDEQAAKDR